MSEQDLITLNWELCESKLKDAETFSRECSTSCDKALANSAELRKILEEKGCQRMNMSVRIAGISLS